MIHCLLGGLSPPLLKLYLPFSICLPFLKMCHALEKIDLLTINQLIETNNSSFDYSKENESILP